MNRDQCAVNYRLNVFGFLGGDALRSRDPRNGTGNYGLLDQRKAMQWTRENIAKFGGDPSSITINGCSAGAGSTANHLVNPRSWPFFDRAAGESGMLAAWNTNSMEQSQTLYDTVVKESHCADADCLAAMNVTDLVTAASRAFKADSNAHWGPTVDGVETTDSPYNLTKQGQFFTRGPVLLGTARDETCSLEGRDWSFGLSEAGFEQSLAEEYGNKTTTAGAGGGGGGGVNISEMAVLYGQQRRPSTTRTRRPVSEWWWAAIEQSSDFSFHCPARYLAQAITKANDANEDTKEANNNNDEDDDDSMAAGGQQLSQQQQVYLFSYNVSFTMWAHWGGVECTPHCAELSGLFFSTLPDTKTPQGQLTDTMVRYFTSFVKHGDPNVERATQAPLWPAFNNYSSSYVHSAAHAYKLHNDSEHSSDNLRSSAASRGGGGGGGGVGMVFALPAAGGVKPEVGYRQRQCDYWDTLPNGPD
eukprot:COSAG06_NODE_457_length_15473_cov_68.819240_3_plen_473_part_00